MHLAGSCPMWHHTCCMLPCSSADPRMSRLWRCHWFVASDHLHVCWQMNAGFSAGRTRKNASWAQVGQRCRGGQKSRIKIGRSNLFKPKNMWANVYAWCIAQGLEHIVTNDQWTFNVFHFVHLSFCRFDDSFPARSQPGMTAAHMCQFRLRAELVRIADYIYIHLAIQWREIRFLAFPAAWSLALVLQWITCLSKVVTLVMASSSQRQCL